MLLRTFRNPTRHGCGAAFKRFSNFLQKSSGPTFASTSSWIKVFTFISTCAGSRFDRSIKFVRNFRHFSLALSFLCAGDWTTFAPDCWTTTVPVPCWLCDCIWWVVVRAGTWDTDTIWLGVDWVVRICCWCGADEVVTYTVLLGAIDYNSSVEND